MEDWEGDGASVPVLVPCRAFCSFLKCSAYLYGVRKRDGGAVDAVVGSLGAPVYCVQDRKGHKDRGGPGHSGSKACIDRHYMMYAGYKPQDY